MKAMAPTTFARMSESLMSRKPLHKRLSRGFATRRSLPPIVEKNWRQKLPGGSPQGCEMPALMKFAARIRAGAPGTGSKRTKDLRARRSTVKHGDVQEALDSLSRSCYCLSALVSEERRVGK